MVAADFRQHVDKTDPQRRRLGEVERGPETAVTSTAFLVALTFALHLKIYVLHLVEKLANEWHGGIALERQALEQVAQAALNPEPILGA